MTLLDKLKSLLGMSRSEEPASEVDVTVEREPDASAADSGGADPGERPVAEATDAAGSTESIVDEEAAAADPEAAAEPAEATSSGDEVVDAEPDDEGLDDPGEAVDVEEIKGIGPAYADKLAGAGVETVGDLAAADAGDLAEATGLGPARVERWIDRAKNNGD
jgi:predicted flap endonuclease-1-like 5' DNA nuclease